MKTKTKIKTRAELKALGKKSDQLWIEYREARRKSDKLYRQYCKASEAVVDGWLALNGKPVMPGIRDDQPKRRKA